MARLRFDDNGYRIQCFTPSENRNNVTVLDTKGENILAIMLPAQATVQVNGAGAATAWPPGIYGIHPTVESLHFSAASSMLIMK